MYRQLRLTKMKSIARRIKLGVEDLKAILADIEQTPGVRRTHVKKGSLYVEGSFPGSEMRSGKMPIAFIAAINRVRKCAKLTRFPLDGWRVDWYTTRPDNSVEYRLVIETLSTSE